MNRRTVLKALTVPLLPVEALRAAESHCSTTGVGSDLARYRFAFFTEAEQELLERLMELIIPADEHSPGAKAARVPAFADLMISTGPDGARNAWRAGLAAFAAAESTEALETVLARAAGEEESPKSDLGRFFVELKRMTIDGYYTSSVGIHEEMRYVGNQHLTAAPSCEHPEHKSR
ncbi:MAG TPA: gluconate 2-dehydrogenase subunit 3 family protein [Bryobacteraceae bacterium]|nr:gluconate 2-dehydrogenase subunit 3 family protein [Bryobacteraceae bacterium]